MNTLNINRIEGQQEKTPPTLYGKMEAIASGVRARFEESTGYSKKLIDDTITVARSLGVDDDEIERWADHRRNSLALDTARFREIKSLLNKAQVIRMLSAAKKARS